MSTVTIRLNDEESRAFKEYAKLYDMPLSTLFKKTLEARIEDEIDMKIIEEYEAKVMDKSLETYEHDEVKEILGL
ncbi:MAG: hypothetical protein GX777_05225 [Fastidiosipila sp.]|nr:hypothetical protein [Fastidiosipila sp.]